MSHKNILALHSSSDLYGASKSFQRSVLAWKEEGHNILVVISESGPLSDSLKQHGVEVIFMSLGIIRRKYMNPKGVVNRLTRMFSAYRSLRKIIKKRQINVVYSNTIAVVIAGFAAKFSKVKHIWHVREITLSPVWFKHTIGYLLNLLSDQVLVVSDQVGEHWGRYVAQHKIQKIYNGVNLNEYGHHTFDLKEYLALPDEAILFGMVARVNFWKGHLYFLEIFNELKTKYPNLHAIMVGDAYPGYEYIYDQINEYLEMNHLTDSVYDLGYRSDINVVLSGLDVFALPSILPDPLPNTVLEAMACSLPVCATAHGGALEMVLNNKTGVHIPWDNAKEAAKLISPLIQETQLRMQMGKEGRSRTEKFFNIDLYKEEMKNIMQD